ncbi:filamentous hemagglutinin family N-terminal domain-containing protein [Fontimonas thermophila]|uniref:Filamentous hemagglutinin family N-terminal domain-containing protein n=1 Tax=Fontimonas thermophila TaxID=1076937 RepID=A0A1I2I7X8_9GAMM|nr:filamentous hemagglutinin N-terminal domain-containing protein [Fontimonas thermophila]SFF37738.1 filamentous hemagglutinin family N-terminal domain-containing protein [Fontimonas thermophila]
MTEHALTCIARILRQRTPLLAWGGLLAPLGTLAAPTGADVIHGQVGIASPGAGGLVIEQTSDTAIINWETFSIGSGEYVLFNQPSASAAVLNRVIGGLPSEILGDLTANGRVFLINPQGILFGAGSRIDVGALVATTHALSDQDFIDGRYLFAGSSSAGVVNAGTIHASDGGFVVLAADHVYNRGTITAQSGDVVLAAAGQLSLQLDPEGLVSVAVDAAALSAAAGVDNAGAIVADGGSVLLHARVAQDLLHHAVNNSGRISAQAIEQRGGEIYLVAAGGDIAHSGILDASGGDGRIVLAGDRDITLTSGALVEASGDRGSVLAIAGGSLDHQAGAHVDVGGQGGTVELSGRGRVRIAGSVDLGRNGHLLIDPATMTIGDGVDADLQTSTLEALLQNNDRGSTVHIVATDTITIQDLGGDNTLNGVNPTDDTKGAGLRLETGTCDQFGGFGECIGSVTRSSAGSIAIQGADDTLDIAGDISIFGGSSSGTVNVNARLISGGDVSIEAADAIDVTNTIDAGGNVAMYANGNIHVGGDIHARGRVDLMTTAGGIDVQNVTVTGRTGIDDLHDAEINIARTGASTSAAVSTGTLSATASLGLASIDLFNANGGIQVGGDIVASGGGFSASRSAESSAAGVFMNAFSGAIDVDGDVTITGEAIDSTIDDSGSIVTTSRGDATLSAYGSSVNFDGSVTVHGIGSAYVSAGTGIDTGSDINFGGALTITAETATETVDTGASRIERHFGDASAYFYTGNGTITTHGIDISGPNAFFDAHADRVVLAGSAGQALRLMARPGDNTFTILDSGNVTVVDSSYGVAAATITGTGGSATNPSIIAGGDITLSGPSAALFMSANQSVAIDGDLAITGQGYRIEGDWTALGFGHAPGDDQSFTGGDEVTLTTGHSEWGGARLTIAGFDNWMAGDVSISGNLSVSGQGGVYADISATGLSVGGDATVHATTGFVSGTLVQEECVDSQCYEVERQIGETVVFDGGNPTVTGTARYSEALFTFNSGNAGTDFDIAGTLEASGDAASIDIIHMGSVHLGSVRALGALGAQAPHVADVANYGPPVDNPSVTPMGPFTTEAIGAVSSVTIGFADGGTPSSVTIDGDVQVQGTGLVGAVIQGNTVSIGGTISLQHDAGRYTSDDPAHSVPPPDFAAALLYVGGVGTPATVTGIDAQVDGRLVTGLDVIASGAVTLQADRLTQTLPGVYSDFVHPASVNEGESGNPDLVFDPLNIQADSITLDFGTDSDLRDAALTAAGTLMVNGHGASLDLGTASWSADSLSIQNTTITALAFNATANRELRIIGGRLNTDSAMLRTLSASGAGILIDHSTLDFDTTAIESASLFELRADTIDAAALDVTSIDLALLADTHLSITGANLAYRIGSFSAGGTLTIDNSGLIGEQTTLSAPSALIRDSHILSDSGTGTLLLAGAQWTIHDNTRIEELGSVTFSGAQTIELQNTAITAGSIDATASSGLRLIQTELAGQTLRLQTPNAAGSGIVIDQSTLSFDDTITLESASTIELRTSRIENFNSLEAVAGGDLAVSGSGITGGEVLLDGASQTLDGIIEGDHVDLISVGSITAATAGLEINAGALDVSAQSIDLTHSTLHVGTGLAQKGQDPDMLELLEDVAPGLLPATSAPNAAFIAQDGVSLGTLTIDGGYLFVRAPFLGAVSIAAPGDLFYNYRPFSDSAPIQVDPNSGSFEVGGSLTLAFGGTGYAGDIEIFAPEIDIRSLEDANYIFLTTGRLRRLDGLSTNGQVVVLGGEIVVGPQQPGPGTNPDQETASAIVLTDDLGGETLAHQNPETDDKARDPEYGDGAQIDIVSGERTELACP